MATIFATALAAEPDPNRVSPFLLDRIEEALNERDIDHGPLREGQPQFNLNLTDRRRVFIKVAHLGAASAYAEDGTPAMGPVNELASAAWVHRHGIRVPNPLVTEPLWILDETGERRAVTV